MLPPVLIWVRWQVGGDLLVLLATYSDATTWFFVQDAPSIAADIWAGAASRNGAISHKLVGSIWDTLNIATAALILVLAVPVAFLAARNTTPSALFIRPLALLLIIITRSINSLIRRCC